MTTTARYKTVVGANVVLGFFDFHLHRLNKSLVPLLLLLLFVGDDVEICGVKSDVSTELDEVKSGVRTELAAVKPGVRTELDAVKPGVRTEPDALKSCVRTELDSGSMTVPLGSHIGRPISHGSLSVPCKYDSPASTESNTKVYNKTIQMGKVLCRFCSFSI